MKIEIQINKRFAVFCLAASVLAIPSYLLASNLTVPNQFANGEIADAGEINQNFDSVEVAVNDTEARLASRESKIAIVGDRIGMGTQNPSLDAKLELNSTTTGFRPPRMTMGQRDLIQGPGAGLMVYNTTTGKLNLHDGTSWRELSLGPGSGEWYPGLNNSLVAYWKLNEASGARADSAGSSHLAEQGGVAGVVGVQGNAAQYIKAQGNHLKTGDNPEISMGDFDFTICGWIRLDTKVESAIVSKTNSSGSTAGSEYLLYYYPPVDGFYFWVTNGSTSHAVHTTVLGGVNTDEWYFVAAWHHSFANKLYVQINDNPPVSTDWAGGCRDWTNDLTIGRVATLNADALVDEVGIWKRILTAQERSDLYNNGNGISPGP